jgi:hypothetical protein
MKLTPETILAAGVTLNLAVTLAKLLFKSPKDRKKIDELQSKAERILAAAELLVKKTDAKPNAKTP